MKKMIAVLVICLSIFLVYYFNKDTKIYYVALGTIENDYYKQVKKNLENAKIMEKSNFLFLKKENTIKGLTVQINNNQTVNEQTIKNALIKADLITIYLEPQIISDNEFDFAKIDKESEKFEKLLKLIKSYCKETIVIIGPQDDESGSLKYLNKTFRNISNKYGTHYIKMDHKNQLTRDILKKVGIKTWF